MVRQIIHIDEDKCNGCGLCATACHEGAIEIVDGKAKLMRENFCDGLGDCLPGCPTGAITFEQREAPAYDESAVEAAKKQKEMQAKMQNDGMQLHGGHPGGGCPGSMMRDLRNRAGENSATVNSAGASQIVGEAPAGVPCAAPQMVASQMMTSASLVMPSQLVNWPVQIKLAPVTAPYFDGAKLLIAADCTAYAYANFHQDFIKGKVTLIGCPKLDAIDYSEKLTAIIANNDIKSVTIVRMEVPCCGGLEMAAKKAIQDSGKFIPWQVVTVGIEGEIIE